MSELKLIMEQITLISYLNASKKAVSIWGITSSQYPYDNRQIQIEIETTLIDILSDFAINARRAIETTPKDMKFNLNSARWNWEPNKDWDKVTSLWESLNRIIHAKELHVGFEKLPDEVSVINNGAIVIPYILAKTDRKKLSYIDPFSMAHAYLYQVMPFFRKEIEKIKMN